MIDKTNKQSLGKKFTAIAAALSVGLGFTLSGCGPEEFEPPEEPGEEVPLPGEPAPEQDDEAPAMPPPDDSQQ
jgi:hypothetical protein